MDKKYNLKLIKKNNEKVFHTFIILTFFLFLFLLLKFGSNSDKLFSIFFGVFFSVILSIIFEDSTYKIGKINSKINSIVLYKKYQEIDINKLDEIYEDLIKFIKFYNKIRIRILFLFFFIIIIFIYLDEILGIYFLFGLFFSILSTKYLFDEINFESYSLTENYNHLIQIFESISYLKK